MELYEILKKLDIFYVELKHSPVFTVKEAEEVKNKIQGIGCKNLFLTDNKKFYLVIIEENKKANIKEISNLLQISHLSFGSEEELKSVLHLSRGSVTPFGILYDTKNLVTVLIDKDLQGKKLLFHPNTNTKTISIQYEGLIKFITYKNHKYIVF